LQPYDFSLLLAPLTMTRHAQTPMTNQQSEPKNFEMEVELLADRAEELIKTLKRLQADNHQLRLQQDQLSAEKVELQDRNRQAKQRIDLIVERLRTLESD
jgi:cell division protein ZapB